MDQAILTAMRESAERLLNDPAAPPESFATFDNGDMAGWARPSEDDVQPEDFEGLKLIVRTNGRPKNAYATCLFSAEFIRDDDENRGLAYALKAMREDCERTLATA